MHSSCPFCLGNKLLKTPIVAQSDKAFLTLASNFEGCYLIVPKTHVESLQELGSDWWQHFSEMLSSIPQDMSAFNITLNKGAAAGQTVPHLHFWVIPRKENEPATGKGLATLISIANVSADA
jgi:histidine triad (HIT) family protein